MIALSRHGLVVSVLVFFVSCYAQDHVLEEQHIVAVIASRNNAKWYKKNLDSVFAQKYDNYHVVYTDDVSTDGTADLVAAYVIEYGMQDRFTLVRNSERVWQLANIYRVVHSLRDSDIVIIVDGDDWLAHDGVFARLNKEYSDSNVWLTYGQFKEANGHRGLCKLLPQEVIRKGSYRSSTWITSHLRSFRAGLFKKIKKEDLMYNGRFFHSATDLVSMFPMLEMAHGRIKFIPDVLYIYNTGRAQGEIFSKNEKWWLMNREARKKNALSTSERASMVV